MRNSRLVATLALALLAFLLAGCGNLGVLRKIPGPGDDLFYVGQNGNVYGVRIDGGQPRLITRDLAPSNGQSYLYLWPTISPDGQRIAYMRATIANQNVANSGIYVANLDGTGEAPIWQSTTDSPVYYAWSPDSKALAMLVTDGVTVSLLLDRSIRWSPDGKRLAFLEAAPPESLHWVVADADGKNRHVLESFLADNAYTELSFYFDQFAQSLSVWSPDSQYLVFTGWRQAPPDGSNEQSHMYVSRADGTGVVRDIAPDTFGYWRRVVAPVAANR